LRVGILLVLVMRNGLKVFNIVAVLDHAIKTVAGSNHIAFRHQSSIMFKRRMECCRPAMKRKSYKYIILPICSVVAEWERSNVPPKSKLSDDILASTAKDHSI